MPDRIARWRGSRRAVLLSGVGALLLVLSGLWWWLIFDRVVANAYMTYREAVPCLLATSDTCSLAMALCTASTRHWLGINRYSASLFWLGLALSAGGVGVTALRR